MGSLWLITTAPVCRADQQNVSSSKSRPTNGTAFSGKPVKALTVRQPIKAGTVLKADDIITTNLTPEELPDGLVQEFSQIDGLVTSHDLEAGQPLTLTKFTNRLGKVEQLPVQAGRRAVSIRVDERTGIEGHAIPGSRVDVVVTFVDPNGDLKSIIIADNAKVLSYGGYTKEQERLADNKRPVADTITLDVSEPEALKILTANKFALMSLIMRTPEDDKTVDRTEQTARGLEEPGQGEDPGRDHIPKEKPGRYCPSTPNSRVPVGTLRFSPKNRVILRLPFFDDCTPRRYIP